MLKIMVGAAAALVLISTLVAFLATDGGRLLTSTSTAQQVTITLASHRQVRVDADGSCSVRAPQRYGFLLLSPQGSRAGQFQPGQLDADGGCVFVAQTPALPDAYRIVVNAEQHFVAGGVGQIELNADDGAWKSAWVTL